MTHLIFFDSSCKLCQNAVKRIQEKDTQKIFTFFPLNSAKAKECLPEKLLKGDTIVLLENEETIWVRAKAMFRILKLLGGKGSGWGWLCHVPGLDLFYRLVARHRHLLK